MAVLSDFPIGSKVSFTVGRLRMMVSNAEVIGYDNGFLQTQDDTGRIRKVRPNNLQEA